MPPLTRGPLPPRVYWRRRVVVLGVALVLVFGIARLLGAGSDASSSAEAEQVSADPTGAVTSGTTTGATGGPGASTTGATDGGRSHQAGQRSGEQRSKQGKQGKQGKHAGKPAPPEPDGPCADEDVVVDPSVEDAVAGRPVTLTLGLRTKQAEACTWQVSRDTLAVKVTSGDDEFWSTRQCPRAIDPQEVVVRRDYPTSVELTWDAKRWNEDCSRFTQWAQVGWYHVVASALAGEPADQQFELARPTSPVITRSPSPHQEPSGRPAVGDSRGSAEG